MRQQPNANMIFAIKLFHSIIYLFMSVCVLYVFYSGITGRIDRWLWIAMGIIIGESVILVSNRMRCPLTSLALHYGDKTGDDLIADWLLPHWMVRYTVPFWTIVFGTGSVLVVLRLIFKG